MWAGYAGTYFWVDPKEELTAIYMSQAPSPIRAYYRKLIKQLVYGGLICQSAPKPGQVRLLLDKRVEVAVTFALTTGAVRSA